MKMATVFESSDPVSMIRKQRGMISVDKRKWMTGVLSFCYSNVSIGLEMTDELPNVPLPRLQ